MPITQARTLYSSPEDDCETPILAAVTAATHSVRVLDYSFNWVAFAEALVERHTAGVDVRLVLDSSQAGGKTEKPVVASLTASGVPVSIGDSQKHRIMHDKIVVIDGETPNPVVISGSFNFSEAAEDESNFVDIETGNTARAAYFTAVFDRLVVWIQNHP